VAKSKNNASGLMKDLAHATTGRQRVSRLLPNTDLVSQVQAASEKAPNIRASGDTKQSSIAGGVELHSIQFGRPSQSSSKSPSTSGTEWTSLLKQTGSGGIASALSGGLTGIGGLGSLISGIVGLFGGGGGNKTPAPLMEFQLPSSQEQTVYLGKGRSVYQSSVAESASVPPPGAGLYSNGGQLQTSGSSPNAQWIQEQSSHIAEAVKSALLNSSSLNDVIGEL
jgi:hypothetical protein